MHTTITTETQRTQRLHREEFKAGHYPQTGLKCRLHLTLTDKISVDVLDNKYQIEQLLGQGGMGAVYRATHLGTKRTVAVKVIQPQLSAHDQFVARFRREAETAGRLRHPNVVDVTDFGLAQTADGPVAAVAECVSHAADGDHGVAALPQDATG